MTSRIIVHGFPATGVGEREMTFILVEESAKQASVVLDHAEIHTCTCEVHV